MTRGRVERLEGALSFSAASSSAGFTRNELNVYARVEAMVLGMDDMRENEEKDGLDWRKRRSADAIACRLFC